MLVPAGSHDVEMRFFPRSLSIGLGLALVGVFLLLIGVLPDSAITWIAQIVLKIRQRHQS
jgi:hypothetical protein